MLKLIIFFTANFHGQMLITNLLSSSKLQGKDIKYKARINSFPNQQNVLVNQVIEQYILHTRVPQACLARDV